MELVVLIKIEEDATQLTHVSIHIKRTTRINFENKTTSISNLCFYSLYSSFFHHVIQATQNFISHVLNLNFTIAQEKNAIFFMYI